MDIIDFHSHFLPEIDDGSKNIETSIRMLQLSYKQGVDKIIATPHFYASKDRVEHFLQKRQNAYHRLTKHLTKDMPEISLGAEVAFFKGISKAEKVDQLTIEGTDILLLEMPFDQWEKADIKEVEKLIRDRHLKIILAHLERYMSMSYNKAAIKELLELPLYVQINAESLLEWRKRRHLVKLFRQGAVHLLGSDCHGMHHRVPNLGEGRDILERKLGKKFMEMMDERGNELLQVEGDSDVKKVINFN